jgi:FtsP/CotA-like multicopper oxidase with cupredoxin domain
MTRRLNRRAVLGVAAGTGALGAASLLRSHGSGAADEVAHAMQATTPAPHQEGDEAARPHPSPTDGDVDVKAMGFDPSAFVGSFDYGQPSRMADGTTVREFALTASGDKQIEIAPGVYFPAWTYNGQVPGPTLRANEGERLRVHFTNAGPDPHTIHFHGIHSAFQDGVPGIGRGDVLPGEQHVYEFDASPFGCHLYHCHSLPLAHHIHKGLYGAFIVNPNPQRGEMARRRHPAYPESAPWQELVMVMNGFDPTFAGENEIYAVNTVAFHYMKHPIALDRARPVRVYLINVTEFDPINSFHLHANFFDYYDHGTTLTPTLSMVDTVMQAQAQRGILEFSFEAHEPGPYMFHAHVSEFTELGWMSAFNVE